MALSRGAILIDAPATDRRNEHTTSPSRGSAGSALMDGGKGPENISGGASAGGPRGVGRGRRSGKVGLGCGFAVEL